MIKRATSIAINFIKSGIHHCSEAKLLARKFGEGTTYAKNKDAPVINQKRTKLIMAVISIVLSIYQTSELKVSDI